MSEIVTPGIYQHYKGNNYKVICVAKLEENPYQEYVVYQQLYESKIRGSEKLLPAGTCWMRSKKVFTEMVLNSEGQMVPRFKKIN
ncbi:DUF1653 domain-containing protein [Candidatus Dependentiae bacterium]|nr:DUF1653 domain-containing protein [Candidatus Dependentiae bacterium]